MIKQIFYCSAFTALFTACAPIAPQVPIAREQNKTTIGELSRSQTIINQQPSTVDPQTPVGTQDALFSSEERLARAEAAFAAGNMVAAQRTLAQLGKTPQFAAESYRVRFHLLHARIAVTENDFARAQSWMQLDAALLARQSRSLQLKWFYTNVDIDTAAGKNLAALKQRIGFDHRLNDHERQSNQRAIIVLLTRLTVSQLQVLAAMADDDITRGWYEIGDILVTYQGSTTLRAQALEDWRVRHRYHPVANNLLQLAELNKASVSIQRIAVFLPLSGPLARVGEAVRSGFELARNATPAPPQVIFYDTALQPTAKLHAEAVQAKAQWIIGPLLKPEVEQLYQLESQIPVLTLNYLDQMQASSVHSHIFQLGLSITDEARFIAEQAGNAGCLNALMIQINSDRGDRGAAALKAVWEQSGGVIVEQEKITADSDLAAILSRMLRVTNQQVATAKTYFNRTLTAEEAEELAFLGRREDTECLFLLAPASQARQIRPLLAFYLANDLPVYATSDIHDLTSTQRQSRDLDGIYFAEIPWLLDTHNPLRAQLLRNAQYSEMQRYERFIALGIDAFSVYPELVRMDRTPQLQITAATGTLTLDAKQQIRRQPSLARFIKGKLTTL